MSLFKKNNLFHNLAKIFSATVLAHAITLAFSPILTRLYLPEAFGLLAFVLSVSNPFSSFSTFRLEQAVVLPKSNNDALKIANTVVVLNTFFSLLLLIFILIFGEIVFQKPIGVLLYIPLIVFITGFQMPLNSWLQRDKKYNSIANGKLIQTIAISVFSILFYWYNTSYGLLAGYLTGWIFYSVYMYYQANKNQFYFQYAAIVNDVKTTVIQYKDFPLYHVLPSVAVSFTLSIPVYYFSSYYSEAEIGWFNFARQMLMVPVSLVTVAFSQVYYARVVEIINHRKKIFPEFKKLVSILFLISLAMTVILFLFGELLFTFIFGIQWSTAGTYASVLVFSAALQLIVWPLNSIPVALGKIKFNSMLQLSHFVLTLCLYLLHNLLPLEFIYFVVAVDVLFFISYFIFIFYQISAHDKA